MTKVGKRAKLKFAKRKIKKLQQQCKGLGLENRELRAQIERLERWKREAIEVLGDWHDVYEALGKPGELGESMAKSSLAAVQRLQEEARNV